MAPLPGTVALFLYQSLFSFLGLSLSSLFQLSNMTGIEEGRASQSQRSSRRLKALSDTFTPRTLMDYYTPRAEHAEGPIILPQVIGDFPEIDPDMINIVQLFTYHGLPTENPYEHLTNFLHCCEIVRCCQANMDYVKLVLFPFSLRDKAIRWLLSLPKGSIGTWADLSNLFLAEFYPYERIVKVRTQITSFKQGHDESLSDAWDRYNHLLHTCPHHNVPDWMLVESFMKGLSNNDRFVVNIAAGGTIVYMEPHKVLKLFGRLAKQLDQYGAIHAFHRDNNVNLDFWSYPVNSNRNPYYDSVYDECHYDSSPCQEMTEFSLELSKMNQNLLDSMYQQGQINLMILEQLQAINKLLNQIEEEREGVNSQCGSSTFTEIFNDGESDETLQSSTQIQELFMPAEPQPPPNLECGQLGLQIDDTPMSHSSDVYLESDMNLEDKEVMISPECLYDLKLISHSLEELGGVLTSTTSKQDGFGASNTFITSSKPSFPFDPKDEHCQVFFINCHMKAEALFQ